MRGINVGGNNIIKMADLRGILTDAGYANVRTYIQSGNIAFESRKTNASKICQHVQDCIEKSHGFAPKALVMDAESVTDILANNPFPDAEDTPTLLHVCFLAQVPADPNIEALNSLCLDTEFFKITDTAVYLHLPEGIGKSKLAIQLEKHVGVPITARNWRSANKVLDLARLN